MILLGISDDITAILYHSNFPQNPNSPIQFSSSGFNLPLKKMVTKKSYNEQIFCSC